MYKLGPIVSIELLMAIGLIITVVRCTVIDHIVRGISTTETRSFDSGIKFVGGRKPGMLLIGLA